MATEAWVLEKATIGEGDEVANSLAARVLILQEWAGDVYYHNHNVERWWGATGAPDETNAIDANLTVPFQATSGADEWGAAIPICGASDNPVLSGMTEFDPHRLIITDMDSETDAWRIRLIYGTGTSADAIAAGQWSEVMLISRIATGAISGGVPVDFRMPQISVGTKLWAQSWNDTEDAVLSFFWGAHGYPGKAGV